MSRLNQFPLMTGEALAKSPSRADRVPENMENRRRRLAAQHMKEVSCKLNMTIVTWAIAVTFFNRFYTRKSMKKNNTFLVAVASLFLASKMENQGKSHMLLANQLLKEWYGKDNPQLLAMDEQRRQALAAASAAAQRRGGGGASEVLPVDPFRVMYDAVLEAERALLYTIGFDFNVDVIHVHLARVVNRPRMRAAGMHVHKIAQNTLVGVANDVYTKDSLLVLQYPLEKIAIAAVYLVLKSAKASKHSDIPQPAPGAAGVPWYVEEGLSAAECVEITNRFTDNLYNKVLVGDKRKAAATPLSPAAPSTTAAGSTAMLGACESEAFTGGGPTLAGCTPSELGSIADALGEHTSVPRPLASDVASGSVHAGCKRAADTPSPDQQANAAAAAAAAQSGNLHASPSKRARLPQPAGTPSTEVTSAAHARPAGHPAQSPAAARLGLNNRGAAAAGGTPAAVIGSTATTPNAQEPVVAPEAADSDREEGELEEGEVQ